jgi:hypothetical protein
LFCFSLLPPSSVSCLPLLSLLSPISLFFTQQDFYTALVATYMLQTHYGIKTWREYFCITLARWVLDDIRIVVPKLGYLFANGLFGAHQLLV